MQPPAVQLGEVVDLGTEVAHVSGQRLLCRVTETRFRRGDQTVSLRKWTCPEVPGGLVKSMMDESGRTELVAELVEFRPSGGQ